jgi:maltooligosyltrehalose synthase
MVATAVEHKLPVHRISAIAKKIRGIPDAGVRERIRQDVVRGRLVAPEKVEEKARKLLKGRKLKAPEDFDRVLSDWTFVLKHWNEKVEDILVYKRFFDGRNTGPVRAEAAKLSKRSAYTTRAWGLSSSSTPARLRTPVPIAWAVA